MAELTFRGYYNRLGAKEVKAPKKEFIERIANICKVSTKTVRGYLAETYQPDALRKEIISKELRIPEAVLFPSKEEKGANDGD